MNTAIYVLRTFGGVLIIPQMPTIAVSIIASRDSKVTAFARDGRVRTSAHDGRMSARIP